MGWGITTMRLPQKVSAWCLAMANSKLQFMFITFILLVIIGTLVDVTPAILIIVPILVPAARAFNVNMLYFGLFVAMTLTMGLVTPPAQDSFRSSSEFSVNTFWQYPSKCGRDLKSAYGLACNLEYVAELQYRTMCIGTPNI